MASCDDCNVLEKNIYWNVSRTTKHRFMTSLGDNEQQLSIPRKFMEHYRGKISSQCTLRGPSRNKWTVEIREEGDDTMFSDGWEQFLDDHGLKPTHFLVFSYAGDSVFDVSIFDDTRCEIEASHFAKNTSLSSCACVSTLHAREKNDSGLGHVLDDEESSYEDEEVQDHEDEEEEEEEEEEDEEEESDEGSAKAAHRVQPTTSRGKRPRAYPAIQHHVYHVSNRRQVTEQEKKRAENLAEVYMCRRENTEAPMIKITMMQTHVYSGFCLTIPKDWAWKHMLHEPHEVDLRVQGSKRLRWLVGCLWRTNGQCQLRSKWRQFVLDNNLEEDDVCVFKLDKPREPGSTLAPIFTVHICRVVHKCVPLIVKFP